MGRLLAGLFEDLQRGMILWQIVIIALALVVAWQVALHLRMRLATTTLVADPDSTLNIGIGGMNRELVPATVLVVLLVGRWVLEYHQPVHLFHIAVPLVLALVMIRVGLPVASHVEIDAGSCLIKLSGIERSCADGRSDRLWRQWYQSGTAGLARGSRTRQGEFDLNLAMYRNFRANGIEILFHNATFGSLADSTSAILRRSKSVDSRFVDKIASKACSRLCYQNLPCGSAPVLYNRRHILLIS